MLHSATRLLLIYISSSVLIGLGWVLGDQWMVIRRYAHFLEYAVMIAGAAAVLWFVWNRRVPSE